jgi:hypothetical protein
MLTIAVSLMFVLAACAAVAVIASSLLSGSRRVRAILAELAEIERSQRVILIRPARFQPQAAFPLLAAA